MVKLKVCYVLCKTEGGAWAFEQLRELRNKYQYEVSIVLSGTTGTLADRFKNEGIDVYEADFDFIGAADLFTLPHKIIKLALFLRKKRFDVIQTHLFNSMVIGRIAAWLADVPIRLSMIAGPLHLEAETPRWIDKITSWMDLAILPSCQYSLDLYKNMGISASKLSLVYYGPDETRFNPTTTSPAGLREAFDWPKTTPLIGMIAYFYPILAKNRWIPSKLHGKALKGHEHLIFAAKIVLEKFPQAKFLLIGKGWGPLGEAVMQNMQALVKKLQLEESIIFTGYRADIPQIYCDLDVSVQASLSENLGATVEALLMECPTVVTRVGGLVDTVIDNKTGILVSPEDSEDLAKGILRLLNAPNEAKLLGKQGRAYMLEKFTLKHTVADLDKLYQRCYKAQIRGYRFHKSFARFFLLGFLGFIVSLRFLLRDVWMPRVFTKIRAVLKFMRTQTQ